jgi:hypothetical protein
VSIRTGSAAVAYALGQHYHPYRSWYRDCQMFVRSCLNVGALYGSAESGYYHTRYRHSTGTPPPGVPVWWTDGGFGHVALSAGGGYCWSNDYVRQGRIDKVPISSITRHWGKRYRGWSEDINGVRIYRVAPKKAAPKKPAVSLAYVRQAARHDHELPQGKGAHEATVLIVEHALKAEGLLDTRYATDGYWGKTSITAYGKWQRRIKAKPPFNGLPDHSTLVRLGTRHGFTVKD